MTFGPVCCAKGIRFLLCDELIDMAQPFLDRLIVGKRFGQLREALSGLSVASVDGQHVAHFHHHSCVVGSPNSYVVVLEGEVGAVGA